DGDHAGAEGVEALSEMAAAEAALAERAFERRMGIAGFDAAKAGAVALEDASPVRQVGIEIAAFGDARLAGANSLVVFGEAGVGGAEGPAAVLTGFRSLVGTAGEASADLAALAW
ncbi:MAG TPA: hypothetical protein PL082_06220, partial [Tepidiformaceae bacterium]|nr:hypothetical protein [Tepidiformaceae bacterium]